MRFDAWNATYPNEYLPDIQEMLETVVSGKIVHRNKGMHGYPMSATISIDGATHGMLAYGGGNPRFFIQLHGEHAQAWANHVQDIMSAQSEDDVPFAMLTRADVCHDWIDERDVANMEPELRRLVAEALEDAKGRPPQWSQFGDFHSLEGRSRGCTLYMGAPSSSLRVRLYDKGLEQHSKGLEAPANLRRVEVQVRPSNAEEKREWAHLPASSFWTVSASVRAVASVLAIPFDGSVFRLASPPTDQDRLKFYASRQYGSVFLMMLQEHIDKGVPNDELVHTLALEINRRKRRLIA